MPCSVTLRGVWGWWHKGIRTVHMRANAYCDMGFVAAENAGVETLTNSYTNPHTSLTSRCRGWPRPRHSVCGDRRIEMAQQNQQNPNQRGEQQESGRGQQQQQEQQQRNQNQQQGAQQDEEE